MKKTLTQQLEKALQDAQYWRGKYEAIKTELQDEKDKNRQDGSLRMRHTSETLQEVIECNRQLMEVVRWHVNPETAKPGVVCRQCGAPKGMCNHYLN